MAEAVETEAPLPVNVITPIAARFSALRNFRICMWYLV